MVASMPANARAAGAPRSSRRRAIFGVAGRRDGAAASLARGTPGSLARGRHAGRQRRQWRREPAMDWRGRVARGRVARHAVAGALLGVAAVGRGARRGAAGTRARRRSSSWCSCLLALATTLPLALPRRRRRRRWPCRAASVLSLAVFHTLTVAGVAAQLVAAYRLGRRGPPLAGRGRSALPFLVLALTARRPARPGSPADRCWPRWPRRSAGPGVARRVAGEAARAPARPGRPSPARCSSTPRAASGPGSPASCTTSSPTTSR